MTIRSKPAESAHSARNGKAITHNTLPEAGQILAAARALPTAATFTRAQVVQLIALAYDAGRTAAYREDLAEHHAAWARQPRWLARTWEQQVADRHRQMMEGARREWSRHPGSGPGWPRYGRFPGGWPLPPTLPCATEPPMRTGPDGWPLPIPLSARKAQK